MFGCDYHTDTEFDPDGEDTRRAAINAVGRDISRFAARNTLTGCEILRIAAQAVSTLEVEGFVEFCPCDNTGKDL